QPIQSREASTPFSRPRFSLRTGLPNAYRGPVAAACTAHATAPPSRGYVSAYLSRPATAAGSLCSRSARGPVTTTPAHSPPRFYPGDGIPRGHGRRRPSLLLLDP